MKSLITIFSIMCISCFINAQSIITDNSKQLNPVNNKVNVPNNIIKYQADKQNNNNNRNKSLTQSMWFSYAQAWQDSLYPTGGASNLFSDYLFPDTLVKIQYSNGTYSDDVHSIATLLDPNAIPVFNKMNFNRSAPYSVDSIKLYYLYDKVLNNIADTLIFQLLTGYEAPAYYFSGTGIKSDFKVDTLYFGGIYFNTSDLFINQIKMDAAYSQLSLPNPNIYTYKYLLTAKDSAKLSGTNYSSLKIATPDAKAAPNTGFVICTVKFKPGYAYKEGTMMSTVNSFQFLSYQEKGANTYPAYLGKNDWNCSYIMPTWAIWPANSSEQSWLGNYVPEWAFTNSFPYDNHYMSFLLSSTVASGITNNDNAPVNLSQNAPNPAVYTTQINYELASASTVSLSVTDMTGREVVNINQGKQLQGKHSMILNTGNLADGMYYYTLYAGNSKLTRKMIVNK